VTDSPALPKPVQQPGPPIIIGGGGKVRTPRLAARFAAEFNHMFPRLDDIAPTRARIVAACEAIERDPSTMRFSAAQVACVGDDDAAFTRRAEALGRQPDELRASGVAGTVAQAKEKLAALEAEGVTRIYLQVLDLDDLHHLESLAALL
jgi:alkanesulfonate monooxygenase SsuD/methylene tetrahydromethanopterin reductase-like flavin-dependent oxidoreductase (luciferase family)